MTVKTGEYPNIKDVYSNYPFEEEMFRCMKKDEAIYQKFYGEEEFSALVSHVNRLFNDALLSGDEITLEDYKLGKNR